ncbi:MAG: hypothetical protein GKS06_14665 [Acidobacteria bacterium]|nr:hypothetical protein [Acidobacteriota bacterium]
MNKVPVSARSVLSVLALGLMGCAGSDSTETEVEVPAEASVSRQLELATSNDHVGTLAREPMLAQHSGGAIFLAGYPSQVIGQDPRSTPQLWRSNDGGVDWLRVDVGSADDGAMGNSDVDLAVAPDGTLYFLVMGFDRSTGEGTHVTIGVSRDVGESWLWTVLSETRFDDRPWVAIAPDGVAHVIWNDDAGVSYASSDDSGATWTEHDRIHDLGGSSHLAVGPDGEMAVRISPIAASANRFHEGVDLVAISVDGGSNWSKYPAPGDRVWDPTFEAPGTVPRWVEPLAWTPDGDLHHFWSSGSTLHLSTSDDHGATWETRELAVANGVAFFPFMTVNDDGELAATWFSSDGADMFAHVALIRPDAEDGPRFMAVEPFQIDSWRDTTEQLVRDSGGEYMPVLFLNDGDLAVAAPIQNPHEDRYGFSFWRVHRR